MLNPPLSLFSQISHQHIIEFEPHVSFNIHYKVWYF